MNTTRIGARPPLKVAMGAALAVLTLTLSACGASNPKAEDAGGTALETPDQAAWDEIVRKAKEEGEVTVFVAPNAEVAFKEFEKEYPEIKVTVERAPTTDLLPRLDQELSVPNPAADVAYFSPRSSTARRSSRPCRRPLRGPGTTPRFCATHI
jgi:iron(III) transport system substrate-binding protein